MVVCMLVSVCFNGWPGVITASAAEDNWSVYADVKWKGEGTEANPFIIETAEQLAGLAKQINGIKHPYYYMAYYRLGDNDINLNSHNWTQIGNNMHHFFMGNFDGNMRTITLDVTNTDSENIDISLFGYLGDGAKIKNLGTTGTITTNSQRSGGIVGSAYTGNVSISNCWSNITIDYTPGGDATAGGIVGLIGTNATVTIQNCYFSGGIKSTGKQISGVGGLCGLKAGTLDAVNCYVAGTFAPDTVGENLSGNGGTFTNCYYMDEISNASSGGTQVSIQDIESGKLAWLLNSNTDGTPVAASTASGWTQGALPGFVSGSGKPATIPVRANGTNGVFRLIRVDGAVETITYPSSPVPITTSGERSWWYQVPDGESFHYNKVNTATISQDATIYLLRELTADNVTVTDTVYTGVQATGNVTVTVDGTTLTPDTDYTLTYANATNVGVSTGEDPPTVTVQGIGDNAGTVTKSFSIAKRASIITVGEGSAEYVKALGDGAFTLSGITHNSDGILAYSSSDTKVVTVDEFGLVSIVGGGMAKITVSMAETETYSAADSKIITIRVNAPFQIEVVNGTTTSDTETVYWDTTVTITADAPATGKAFDKWTTEDGVTFADANNATTTFVMPANQVAVTATYKDIPITITGVVVSPSSTSVQKSTTQAFTAIVSGTGNYDETVTWSVYNAVHPNTMIDLNGVLAVHADETATTLTVKAQANGDSAVTSTATVTITDAPVIKYMLTVNNGSDSGEYAEGEEVSITAGTPGIGKEFMEWSGIDSLTFTEGNKNTDTARFIMPNQVLTITATYRNITVDSIAVNSTTHKTAYKVGEALDVTNLTISATMSDSNVQPMNVTAGMVSGFDSSAVTASQTLIITYEGKTIRASAH